MRRESFKIKTYRNLLLSTHTFIKFISIEAQLEPLSLEILRNTLSIVVCSPRGFVTCQLARVQKPSAMRADYEKRSIWLSVGCFARFPIPDAQIELIEDTQRC